MTALNMAFNDDEQTDTFMYVDISLLPCLRYINDKIIQTQYKFMDLYKKGCASHEKHSANMDCEKCFKELNRLYFNGRNSCWRFYTCFYDLDS